MKSIAVWCVLILSVLFLSACGGGGGGSSTTSADIPTIDVAYVDKDFATEVEEAYPVSSNLSEFIQLCETCEQ